MSSLEKVYAIPTDKIIQGRGLHFFVIGTGGTGGYLIPNLARQISIKNIGTNHKHKFTVADADIIENENLVRQNFIQADIGKNKAETMARRYSGAFGIEIGVVNEYVETSEQLQAIVSNYEKEVPVFIGCVDNNKSRQLVYRFFSEYKKEMFWLDSGNSEYTGQVVLGYNNMGHSRIPATIESEEPFYLPCVADVYPDIINDTTTKFVSEMSCAERAVHDPQCIATNITAANILFNFSNALLNSNSIGNVRTGMVTFNTRTNGFNHRPITKSYLASRYVKPQEKVEVAAG